MDPAGCCVCVCVSAPSQVQLVRPGVVVPGGQIRTEYSVLTHSLCLPGRSQSAVRSILIEQICAVIVSALSVCLSDQATLFLSLSHSVRLEEIKN